MSTQTVEQRPAPQYWIVLAVLVIFTALEAGTAYLPTLPIAVKVGLLVFLAVVKIALVLLYFMHLKFDSRIFVLPFALGVVLVISLLLIVGLTMNQATLTASAEDAAVSTTGQVVNVSEVSFRIHMSQDHALAGPITFHIVNGADNMLHEFLLIKTDLPADELPTDESGRVMEDAVTIITTEENIPPSQARNMSVNLAAGHYVMICNLPEHYLQGMHVEFTVTGNTVGTPTIPESTPQAASTEASAAATSGRRFVNFPDRQRVLTGHFAVKQRHDRHIRF